MERRLHDFIPYLRDLYTINDKGEVFSDNTGKMKTRNKGNTEYQIINFMKEDGKKKTFRLTSGFPKVESVRTDAGRTARFGSAMHHIGRPRRARPKVLHQRRLRRLMRCPGHRRRTTGLQG